MRFYVVCIGKLKDAYLRDGVAEVCKTDATSTGALRLQN